MGRYARQDAFNASRRGCRAAAASGGGAPAGDPYFANVSLLTPLDGADAATTAPDESTYAHSLVFDASTELDTADKKFGTAAGYFDGTAGAGILVANHAAFDYGTGDYTMEAWAKFETGSLSADRCIFSKWDSASGSYRGFLLFMDATDNKLEYFTSSQGITTRVYHGDANAVVSEDTWHHVAVCRASGTTRVFLDGVNCSEQTVADEAIFAGTSDVKIGRLQGSSSGTWPFKGWIDDVRFTKGVARYTENFTPPIVAHPIT